MDSYKKFLLAHLALEKARAAVRQAEQARDEALRQYHDALTEAKELLMSDEGQTPLTPDECQELRVW